MSASSTTEQQPKEQIEDNLSNVEVKQPTAEIKVEEVDQNKLAALKAKSQAKQQEAKMTAKIVAKKERSLNIALIGSGEFGSRIAQTFYELGYNAICCNTTNLDLKNISIPDSNKLLFTNHSTIGGAAKELSIGEAAAEAHRGDILQLINEKLGDSQVNILALSLGGGSGAGSAETMVDLLSGLGKPLIVMTVLPMSSDDMQAKSNALATLAKLTKLTQSKKINNLILVDNSKIESIYSNVSQMDFYKVANKAIVEPIDIFNTLSSMTSTFKSLDAMEWSKIMLDGEGLTAYGQMTIDNYEDDTALAEGLIGGMSNNLLASGFDIKQARYVGFIITANKEVWSKIPSSSLNYATAILNDTADNPKGIFKGIYTVESNEPVVKVYSIFSGLLLPDERIEQLKNETKELVQKAKAKDENRSASLHIDTGKNETISAADKVKEKIAAKSSTFGKFINNNVIDRRNK